MGKSPDQVVPALCRKFPLWGGTPFKTVETIGDNDSACLGFGQNFAWEIVGDSEVETVTPLQIVAPFPVAGEILSRGFDLDNGDRAATSTAMTSTRRPLFRVNSRRHASPRSINMRATALVILAVVT